jgi:hypothetical protein
MKNWATNILIFIATMYFVNVTGQSVNTKKPISDAEKVLIQKIFEQISISDQLYRGKIAKGTLDEKIIAKIDSVFNTEGIKAGLVYEKSLNLSLPKATKDSLWKLQSTLDLQNHLILRGLWETYGFIPKEVIKEKQYVQTLLLLHPPKDWDIEKYLKEYSTMLLLEVKAGRMPAMAYASFYDNMLAKILKRPQLYGTNQEFNMTSKKILPPIIDDIKKTNKARQAIGLSELSDGEYRLSK